MKSSRRFKPPSTLVRENSESYVVRDANGVTVAWLYCRDDSQRYSVGVGKLSSDEARRIGKAIARIPEFMISAKASIPAAEVRAGAPIAPTTSLLRIVTSANTGTRSMPSAG
jgi:hypothetical protein